MTGIAAPTAASKFSAPPCFSAALRQPQAVLGDQRLVGGHHRLAGFQRGLDRRQRGIAGTAHQFDEAVDAGIVGQRQRIFGPVDAAQVERRAFSPSSAR